MNTMTYKGYTARIEFDDRDNIFVGRILGLRAMISFHGQTVTELREAFAAAVDDFLADCKEQGISPEKPTSGKLMLRISPEVHGAALVAAHASGKSLNQWAAEVIQHASEAYRNEALRKHFDERLKSLDAPDIRDRMKRAMHNPITANDKVSAGST